MTKKANEAEARAFLNERLQKFVDDNDDEGTRSTQPFLQEASNNSGITDNEKLLIILHEEKKKTGYRGQLVGPK